MARIVIKDVRKEFGDFTAVQASSFTIEDGEFFMLLGPSGCGKTTTLRMIAGLELPTSGEIYIDGEEVGQKPASQRDIAFVFQMFALYPHMNVRRNISYPLVSQGMGRAEVKARVAEVARILGIEDILDRPVGGLSGGDRQRVALGRAIVRRPKAFMMDEPLGALDAEFREHMSEELRALHDRMGATTVYVTHDQLEAMQMGDKIVVMNHGVVEQFGTPQDIYDKPATMFVADFIGAPAMNLMRFDGEVAPGATSLLYDGAEVAVPRMREGRRGALALGVRPEHVHLDDAAPHRGRIAAVEYLGTTQILTLETATGALKLRAPAAQVARVGETVGLRFNGRTLSVFDARSGAALASDLNAQGGGDG
ncbi:MAG: ABC transporter ATP-binding protein [Rhodobacteraceae bacterium]|nr:ABC transporter ATP-binding protein [Paracoccaceae bacterium]